MSVINTNYLALVSQNNLSKSQNALGTAIERLSSGLRINSAKDDAAGQAIANRFSANIKGLTQAGRNANDGISIAQTTEGALNEINNNLQRVRELSVQAANGTNSDSDLKSIQDEINQRLSEIDRVSSQTQFNGVRVLASNDNNLQIQVGANDNELITIGLKQINSETLGLGDFQVQNKTELATVTNGNVGAAFTSRTIANDSNSPAIAAEGLYALKDGSGYVVKAGGDYYTATTTSVTDGVLAVTGWDSSDTAVDVDDVDVDGGDIQSGRATIALTGGTTYSAILDQNGTATGDYVTLEADGKYYDLSFNAAGAGTKATEASSLVVTTDRTVDALSTLDKALAQVDSLRSELGAVQNRFESTIANLNNTVNNLSAARSRIEDADYAVEVSNMTRAQILQQAGTSVLAQANQVPQTVLSLLR
ncbi:FliC/FljB family flagellin [Pusillimonas sp. CC-YST705]|uniref:Flagellin n=1 Tax=Mesopusillimonas faecipullorum TaxID=2755040 RepID=A0ABS8C898_9BURK|nr:FliC/FljB family flagellin [Mesopusillimonas faecipullorum]MCB5362256.1 FliC/FljB family flagellin [Mesopusillimonas faecipullorum]